MTTQRTQVVDKNNKVTHVHKSLDKNGASGRTINLPSPSKSAIVAASVFVAEVSEAAIWNPEAYLAAPYDTEYSEIIEPANRSETVKQLNDATGRKSNGKVRWIDLNAHNTDTSRVHNDISKFSLPMSERPDTFNIVPPKNGTPMIVHNRSGFNQLNVESGNAIISLNSRFGNPIRIAGDANVVVILGESCKCSVTVEGDAVVRVIVQNGSRGSLVAKGDLDNIVIENDEKGSFSNISIPIDYEARDRERAEAKASEEKRLSEWMESHS